ncbi:MAG: hypothetical protein AAFO02_23895 [Bacteroidota bacterium]
MLSFFRTNQLFVGVLILGYAFLLHLVCLWEPASAITDAPGIANQWLQAMFNERLSWHLPTTVLLLFIQALLVNSIIFKHRMLSPVNLFPGVFLVLVSSAIPDFLALSAYHFANVFLLLAVRSYLNAFRVQNAAGLIFNAGFWMGLAVFFVPSYVFFLLGFSIMLPILKSGKFRDQLILILGTAFPLYMLGVYYFWTDQFRAFWTQQWSGVISLPEFMNWDAVPYFRLLFLSALLMLVIFSHGQYRQKSKMDVQIKYNILYWLLLASGISALFTMPWNLQHALAAAPFIGVFLSINFTKARPATAEAWHLLLLVLVFLLQFGPRFGIPFI